MKCIIYEDSKGDTDVRKLMIVRVTEKETEEKKQSQKEKNNKMWKRKDEQTGTEMGKTLKTRQKKGQ